MNIPEDSAHRLALALAGRCPRCAERTEDSGLLSGKPCVRCGGVEAGSFGDLLLAQYRLVSRERLGLSLALLGGAGMVLGFVPLLGAAVLLVSLGLHQIRVVAPALLLLSRRRRRVVRWTQRFFTATVLVGASLATTLASAAGLGGPVTAVVGPLGLGLTWLVSRRYLLWQLERERAKRPVARGEVALLAAALGALVGAALAVAAVATAVVALVQHLVEKVLGWL